MIKVLDFLSIPLTIYLAMTWSDGVSLHKWILVFAIVATNLLGYARGVNANK
jgi:hypothetical protein